jgi:isocitrate dehydrogenase (NAD+)
VKWEPVDVTPQLVDGKTSILPGTIESIKRNKVALKGPLAVSIQLLTNQTASNLL